MGTLKQVGLAVMICFVLVGCSAYKASTQPDKRNIGLLQEGTHRSLLIAEFGSPLHTEVRDGKKQDIFRFVQGYGKATKGARAVGHGVATVATLGLWEVFGTPIEGTFDGTQQGYLVVYDDNDIAVEVKRLVSE